MIPRLHMTKWLTVLSLAGAGLAQAGVRIESRVSPHQGLTVDSVVEVQGDRFRINHQDAATGEFLRVTIYDGERILSLRPKDKTYTSMSMADLKAQMAGFDAMKDKLSPEARAQFDKRALAPSFTFKRASGGETLAGTRCENYQVSLDGAPNGTACLAAWKPGGPVTKADLAPMKKLADQMRALGARSGGDIGMGPDFDSWPGWPLVMRGPDGHERSRLVKVSRVSFPAGDFQPPAGYSQRPLPSLGGARQPLQQP
jgi:hypothetical protein